MKEYQVNTTDQISSIAPLERGSGELPAWCAFAVGGIVTFLFVYIGIARPAAHEMSRMESQIRMMQESLSAIVGQEEAARETTGLLAALVEQTSQREAASGALDRIQQLHDRVNQVADQSQYANQVLVEMMAVRDDMVRIASQTSGVASAISKIESLQLKLAESSNSLDDALQATDELYALEQDLVTHGYDLKMARDALAGLIQIRERLELVGDEVQQAESGIDDLVELKDKVLSETRDLASAVETLELNADLHEQFHDAALSFERIRSWMIEVVGMESLLDRATRSLQPLTALGNLRRLSDDELRLVARGIRDRNRAQLASKPQFSAEITEVDPDHFLPSGDLTESDD